MQVVYAREPFPASFSKSLFLAGPTPRSADVVSWRRDALAILEELRYDGVVFVPEDRDWGVKGDYDDQIHWEDEGLNLSDCALFWIPRDLVTMPAFTTNDEWGTWKYSGKVVFGAPPDAPKTRYQREYAWQIGIPSATTLRETLHLALAMIGEGALRIGGERHVPLHVWNTPSFRSWYGAQRAAGHLLEGARVLWAYRLANRPDAVFSWILQVQARVAGEDRVKTNEFVIARPDVSAVLLYHPAARLEDTEIVLVREYRAPGASPQGFVWELPSGSTFNPSEDPRATAIHEVLDETGFGIDPSRLRGHLPRQFAATFSAHKGNLYSLALTDEEIAAFRDQEGRPHGVIEDTERTYVHVVKLRDLRSGFVDWSTLGMILSVLTAP